MWVGFDSKVLGTTLQTILVSTYGRKVKIQSPYTPKFTQRNFEDPQAFL